MTPTTMTPKARETAVSRWSPFESLMEPVFPSLGRLFSDAWSRWPHEETGLMAPALDVSEDEEALTVSAELPGLKKEDVKIQVDGGVLSISGEKTEESEEKGRTFHRRERRHGAFHRSVTLPSGVDCDKADAEMHDGVLCIRFPWSEAAKPKMLKIK